MEFRLVEVRVPAILMLGCALLLLLLGVILREAAMTVDSLVIV